MNKDIREMNYGPSLESSELALKWLSKNNNKFGHFINGKMTTPINTFKTINPANSDILASISKGSLSDVNNAVKSAKVAFKNWKNLKPFERSKYLYALARLIQKHSRFLAVLESIDNGKPIRETRKSFLFLIFQVPIYPQTKAVDLKIKLISLLLSK